MMDDLTGLLGIAHAALDAATGLARTRPPGALTAKGDRDYTSEVDLAIERTVRAFLSGRTPGIPFVGEEENDAATDTAEWWTLDPIDGTVNFTHDIPLSAISLALVRDRRPVLGVIDLPFLNSRYWATENQGAHRDGERVHVRDVSRLANAVVAVGDYAVGKDAEARNRTRLHLTQALAGQALRVRMFGSAAIDLAWLAEGRLDASLTLSNRSWDVAAGVILAREAGAAVLDLDGTEHTTDSTATLAMSPGLREHLLPILGAAVATHRG